MPSASASATSQGDAGISSRVLEGDEGDLATLAPGGPGHVHGHVAAADDRHLFALKIEGCAGGRIFEIFDAPQDALGLGAGHRQADGVLGPDAQENGPEAFLGEQIVDGAAFAAKRRSCSGSPPPGAEYSPLPAAGLPGAGGIPECRSAASRRLRPRPRRSPPYSP